jgi:hypothetical protein
MPQTSITVVWGCGHFALLLATKTIVAASLNISVVVTEYVVEKFSQVFGGTLLLSVSKDNDLTYDFKRGPHFLNTI